MYQRYADHILYSAGDPQPDVSEFHSPGSDMPGHVISYTPAANARVFETDINRQRSVDAEPTQR